MSCDDVDSKTTMKIGELSRGGQIRDGVRALNMSKVARSNDAVRGSWLNRLKTLLIISLLTGMMGVAAAEPRYGGSVKGFIAVEPRSLNPHTASISGGQQAISGIYSGLLQYDPQNPRDIIPDLAERWDVAEEGKVYTFHLRRGVQWHDGVTFTAADVQATFARLLASKNRDAPCGSWLQSVVEQIETLDDYTVRINLKFPAASIPSIVASPWCRIVAQHILARDATLSQAQSQVGTGPFELQHDEPNRQIVWTRNPNYYDPGYPYVNEITHSILPHPAQGLRAASFGDIYFWSTWAPMSYTQSRELQKARGDDIELYKWPLNTVWTLYLNPTRAPFNAPEMRRAVHLALDRQHLMDTVFQQSGTPCAILPPNVYGDWALPLEEVMALPGCRQPKDTDLAEAQRLVSSRYPNGVDVDILVRSVGDYLDRAELLVPQLQKIGIRVRFKAYESSAAWRAYERGKYDIVGTEDTLVMLPDPSAPFTLLFAAQTPYNWGRWQDPRVETLVEQGLRAQAPEHRRQLYHALQQHLLNSDSPTVVVGWIDGWYFRDKRLQAYQPSSIGYGNTSWAHLWVGPPDANTQVHPPGQAGRQDASSTAAANPAVNTASSSQTSTDMPASSEPPPAAPPRPSEESPSPQPTPSAPSPEAIDQKTTQVTLSDREPASEARPSLSTTDIGQEAALKKVISLFERFFPDGGDFHLTIEANKDQQATYTAGENLQIRVVSDRDAFLRVDYYQANGEVIHLLPNMLDNHQLKAGKVFTLGSPDDAFQFKITPPFGLEMITVVASQKPSDVNNQTSRVERTDAYVERLAKGFETLSSSANAAAYLLVRTQQTSDTH